MKHLKFFFTIAVISSLLSITSSAVFAQSTTVDMFDLNQAIDLGARKEQVKRDQFSERLKTKLLAFVDDYKNALNSRLDAKDEDESASIFLDAFIETIATERVVSKTLEQQVRTQMIEDTQKAYSGNKEIEDGNSDKATANPLNGIAIENQARLQTIFNKYFCIPESKNATEDCQAKKGQINPPYENFVDFFMGSGTWQNNKVLDVLTLSRAFFAGMTDKLMLGQGSYDPGSFYRSFGNVAKANLRMSILNDLAGQRAPTSEATESVVGQLLKALVPTGEISSLDYKTVCSNQQNIGAYYACSMTAPPLDTTTNKRLISQTAMDRIMQFDYMLSSSFYTDINDPTLSSRGGVDKIAVYLKSQQVAQDYRALRLLQMKVAATAVNMMNGE